MFCRVSVASALRKTRIRAWQCHYVQCLNYNTDWAFCPDFLWVFREKYKFFTTSGNSASNFSIKKEGTARIFFSLLRTVPLLLLFLILRLNLFCEVGEINPSLGFFFQSSFGLLFFRHQFGELCRVGGVFEHLIVKRCNLFLECGDIVIDGLVLALFFERKFQAGRTVLLPVIVLWLCRFVADVLDGAAFAVSSALPPKRRSFASR